MAWHGTAGCSRSHQAPRLPPRGSVLQMGCPCPLPYFAGVRHVVDLCAAPGSWSQVGAATLGGTALLLPTIAMPSGHDGMPHASSMLLPPHHCTQVLSRRLYLPAAAAGKSGAELPKIVAVDLQPMASIEGVTQLQVRARMLLLCSHTCRRACSANKAPPASYNVGIQQAAASQLHLQIMGHSASAAPARLPLCHRETSPVRPQLGR